MIVYKSSAFVIIKNVIYGVIGGVVAAFIAHIFLQWYLSAAIGVVLGLFVVYIALIGDNIKVVIDGDALSVYRRGKRKYYFKISEVELRARIKTTDGDSDCDLSVTERNGDVTCIDCSMLGKSRFYKLLESLHVTDAAPAAVRTR